MSENPERGIFPADCGRDDLDRCLRLLGMRNGWAKRTPSLYAAPRHEFLSASWRYKDAREALKIAGSLVNTDEAERRNLILVNPVPGNEYPTVQTLVAAYQMVKAGEQARSHRHTPNAMRIVLDAGEHTYTVVDGVKIPMCPGDVLLTPSWCYHGHRNDGNVDAYWIDVLDVPLVQFLGPMFFEAHRDGFQHASVVEPGGGLRFVYNDYRSRLLAAEASIAGVRMMKLGPPTLATFDHVAVNMRKGAAWALPKTTANYIYAVLEGDGVTDTEGNCFQWERGDVIAVPRWIPHRHKARSDAVLLRVSDEPLMRALEWYRTENGRSGHSRWSANRGS